MLTLIDKLAGWWLDWRFKQFAEIPTELGNFELKKVVLEDDGLTVEGVSPVVAVLAEQAAMMLQKGNAENYLEFDMMPRLDRGLKMIRVTVQWAHGKSPAQRVTEYETERATLTKRVETLEAELASRQLYIDALNATRKRNKALRAAWEYIDYEVLDAQSEATDDE